MLSPCCVMAQIQLFSFFIVFFLLGSLKLRAGLESCWLVAVKRGAALQDVRV